MGRIAYLLPLFTLAIPGFDNPRPAFADGDKDPDLPYGSWEAVAGEFFGEVKESGDDLGMAITLAADKATWYLNTSEGVKSYDGLFRIDETRTPKQIDLGLPGRKKPEKLLLGIYRLEGETLTIHMGAERPSDFSEKCMVKLALKRLKGESELSSKKYVARARARLAKREYERAIADCTSAIASDSPAEAYRLRGRVYASLVATRRALDDLNTAAKLKPLPADALKMRASAHLLLGQYDEALRDCDAVIHLKANDVKAHYWRATAHQAKGRHEAAIRDCTTALRHRPAFPEARFCRAISYEAAGDQRNARADFVAAREDGRLEVVAYRIQANPPSDANAKALVSAVRRRLAARGLHTAVVFMQPAGRLQVAFRSGGEKRSGRRDPLAVPEDLFELRLVANQRDHAEIIRKARATCPRPLVEGRRIVARWVPLSDEMQEPSSWYYEIAVAVEKADSSAMALVLEGERPIGSASVTVAVPTSDGDAPGGLSFGLDDRGASAIRRLTRANRPLPDGFHRRLGIVINGELRSAPAITVALGAHSHISSASFESEECEELARLLNAGPLPHPLEQIERE